MTHQSYPFRIYDQVLTQFEAGQIKQGTLMLAGVFDGILASGGDLKRWRLDLKRHPLRDLLSYSPPVEGSEAPPPARSPAAFPQSSALTNAVDEFSGNRARAARAKLTEQALRQAIKNGKLISFADGTEQDGSCDLIAAPHLPDKCTGQELIAELSALKAKLASGGTILISSLVPGYFGIGWQYVCNGVQPFCHDEDTLSQVAAEAGLALKHFRDASDCLIWGVLSVSERDADGLDIFDG